MTPDSVVSSAQRQAGFTRPTYGFGGGATLLALAAVAVGLCVARPPTALAWQLPCAIGISALVGAIESVFKGIHVAPLPSGSTVQPIIRPRRLGDDFDLVGLVTATAMGGVAYGCELLADGLGFLAAVIVVSHYTDDAIKRYRIHRWEAAYSRTLYVRSRWNPETRSMDEDAEDDKVLYWAVEADRAEGEPRAGQLPRLWPWFIRTSDELS